MAPRRPLTTRATPNYGFDVTEHVYDAGSREDSHGLVSITFQLAKNRPLRFSRTCPYSIGNSINPLSHRGMISSARLRRYPNTHAPINLANSRNFTLIDEEV
ncbi:hypothetical protein J6590_032850 [Homalodisca vitripennis]|nr:hypothetical protein J6590_032850 [Homalodisca vitripennis]